MGVLLAIIFFPVLFFGGMCFLAGNAIGSNRGVAREELARFAIPSRS